MGGTSAKATQYIEIEARARAYLDDFDTGQLLEELERRSRLGEAAPIVVRILRNEGFHVAEPDYPPSTAAGITDLRAFAAWRARQAAAATPTPRAAPPSGLWFWANV